MKRWMAWTTTAALMTAGASASLAHEGAHEGMHGGHDGPARGVWFEEPKDGATVSREFEVKMRVAGMTVRKAGEIVPGTGHFHIIVDGGCVKKGEVVAKDATHMHFGKGQEETTLSLEPGTHALSLQLADGHHVSYGKDWCQTIHVTVK